MGLVKDVQAPPIGGELHFPGQAILVILSPQLSIEAKGANSAVSEQIKSSNPPVVTFGEVERPVVRCDRHAEIDAVRIGIQGLKSWRNLDNLWLGSF